MPDASGAERIRDAVNDAPQVKPEPPRPLMRELAPATPFPADALGILKTTARATTDPTRAPRATCGQSLLGTPNLAVEPNAHFDFPCGGGPVKPISCYLVT